MLFLAISFVARAVRWTFNANALVRASRRTNRKKQYFFCVFEFNIIIIIPRFFLFLSAAIHFSLGLRLVRRRGLLLLLLLKKQQVMCKLQIQFIVWTLLFFRVRFFLITSRSPCLSLSVSLCLGSHTLSGWSSPSNRCQRPFSLCFATIFVSAKKSIAQNCADFSLSRSLARERARPIGLFVHRQPTHDTWTTKTSHQPQRSAYNAYATE